MALRKLTRAELRAPLVPAVSAVVDGVADEVVVDADAVVALEALPAAILLGVLESGDDQTEAVLRGAPRVGDVLQRDEVRAGEHDAVGAERVHRLLAGEVRLKREFETI